MSVTESNDLKQVIEVKSRKELRYVMNLLAPQNQERTVNEQHEIDKISAALRRANFDV
ncbi:hypothetical protein [Levilactobacillus fujinensis]|uniref:Uncharacterized protein n=1 Tax=Levilactobacillus fujinensis TaxID=2486024 RepID=A0ABW1TC64_9LACO|nr:hypothetical protein [Levilactobacillus fujinensis]